MLVLRVTGEGYVLVETQHSEQLLNDIQELWDTIFEEACWGSIEHALILYRQLFKLIDKTGRMVEKYSYGADVVLPPRNLTARELQDLLGKSKR